MVREGGSPGAVWGSLGGVSEAGESVALEVLSVNGIKLRDFPMLVELIQLVRDQEVYFVVKRGEGKNRLSVIGEMLVPAGAGGVDGKAG